MSKVKNDAPASVAGPAKRVISLDEFLSSAEKRATLSMRTFGRVDPVILIATAENKLLMIPASMADEREKDAFAVIARLMCVAYAAEAIVFVAEAWLSISSARNPSERPSEAPDRKEVVLLLGEAYGGCKQKILPILRTTSGDFCGFTVPDDSPWDSAEGRFTNLLPRERPTPDKRAEAQELLKKIAGIDFVLSG